MRVVESQEKQIRQCLGGSGLHDLDLSGYLVADVIQLPRPDLGIESLAKIPEHRPILSEHLSGLESGTLRPKSSQIQPSEVILSGTGG